MDDLLDHPEDSERNQFLAALLTSSREARAPIIARALSLLHKLTETPPRACSLTASPARSERSLELPHVNGLYAYRLPALWVRVAGSLGQVSADDPLDWCVVKIGRAIESTIAARVTGEQRVIGRWLGHPPSLVAERDLLAVWPGDASHERDVIQSFTNVGSWALEGPPEVINYHQATHNAALGFAGNRKMRATGWRAFFDPGSHGKNNIGETELVVMPVTAFEAHQAAFRAGASLSEWLAAGGGATTPTVVEIGFVNNLRPADFTEASYHLRLVPLPTRAQSKA